MHRAFERLETVDGAIFSVAHNGGEPARAAAATDDAADATAVAADDDADDADDDADDGGGEGAANTASTTAGTPPPPPPPPQSSDASHSWGHLLSCACFPGVVSSAIVSALVLSVGSVDDDAKVAISWAVALVYAVGGAVATVRYAALSPATTRQVRRAGAAVLAAKWQARAAAGRAFLLVALALLAASIATGVTATFSEWEMSEQQTAAAGTQVLVTGGVVQHERVCPGAPAAGGALQCADHYAVSPFVSAAIVILAIELVLLAPAAALGCSVARRLTATATLYGGGDESAAPSFGCRACGCVIYRANLPTMTALLSTGTAGFVAVAVGAIAAIARKRGTCLADRAVLPCAQAGPGVYLLAISAICLLAALSAALAAGHAIIGLPGVGARRSGRCSLCRAAETDMLSGPGGGLGANRRRPVALQMAALSMAANSPAGAATAPPIAPADEAGTVSLRSAAESRRSSRGGGGGGGSYIEGRGNGAGRGSTSSGGAGSAGGGGADDYTSALGAAAGDVTAQLVSLGFSQARSRNALLATGGNMEQAANLLYADSDVGDETIAALASAAVTPAAAAPASATELVAMGFPRQHSEFALRAASGRVELAADLLMRPDFVAIMASEGGDAGVEAAGAGADRDSAAGPVRAARPGARASSPIQLPGQVTSAQDDESGAAGSLNDEGFDALSGEGMPEVGSGSNAAAAATPAPTLVVGADARAAAHNDNHIIAHLVAMGFAMSASRRACAATSSAGVEEAAEWLLAHDPTRRVSAGGGRGAKSSLLTEALSKVEGRPQGAGPSGATKEVATAEESGAAEEQLPAEAGAQADDERIVMAELAERESAERAAAEAENEAAERAVADELARAGGRSTAGEGSSR